MFRLLEFRIYALLMSSYHKSPYILTSLFGCARSTLHARPIPSLPTINKKKYDTDNTVQVPSESDLSCGRIHTHTHTPLNFHAR